MFRFSNRVAILGPAMTAVSGVSTHLIQLFGSSIGKTFELLHFQVGSEGRQESKLLWLTRLVASPVAFLLFLLRYRPSIVHLNTSLEPRSYWRDVAYLIVARLMSRKIVYQVHGGALPNEFFPRSRILSNLLRQVLHASDVVVLLAQVEARAYLEFAPGVLQVVIPNAIDSRLLAGQSLESKPTGELHLVFIGRLSEGKGILSSLEAVALLRRGGHSIRLTIAGGGPEARRLEERTAELGLTSCVRFVGPLFGEAKDRLWQEGHVFVFPTHREGLPYALLEAMAAGAVPVTTRVGAIPDVMEDGVHGLFVEAHDVSGLAAAIARLDDDRALLKRMAQAGRDRVLEGYAVERLAADFRRLYLSLDGAG